MDDAPTEYSYQLALVGPMVDDTLTDYSCQLALVGPMVDDALTDYFWAGSGGKGLGSRPALPSHAPVPHGNFRILDTEC